MFLSFFRVPVIAFFLYFSTLFFFFIFNDTATTEIYTLSLHDALPISTNPHEPNRTNQDYSCYFVDRIFLLTAGCALLRAWISHFHEICRRPKAGGWVGLAGRVVPKLSFRQNQVRPLDLGGFPTIRFTLVECLSLDICFSIAEPLYYWCIWLCIDISVASCVVCPVSQRICRLRRGRIRNGRFVRRARGTNIVFIEDPAGDCKRH